MSADNKHSAVEAAAAAVAALVAGAVDAAAEEASDRQSPVPPHDVGRLSPAPSSIAGEAPALQPVDAKMAPPTPPRPAPMRGDDPLCSICQDVLALEGGDAKALPIAYPCGRHVFHAGCILAHVEYEFKQAPPLPPTSRCPLCREAIAAERLADWLRALRAANVPLPAAVDEWQRARPVRVVLPAQDARPRDRRLDPWRVPVPFGPEQERVAQRVFGPAMRNIHVADPRAPAAHQHAVMALLRRQAEIAVINEIGDARGTLWAFNADPNRFVTVYGARVQLDHTGFASNKFNQYRAKPRIAPHLCQCGANRDDSEGAMTVCEHMVANQPSAIVFPLSGGNMNPDELYTLLDVAVTRTAYFIMYNFAQPDGNELGEVKHTYVGRGSFRVNVGGDASYIYHFPQLFNDHHEREGMHANRWSDGVRELTWGEARGSNALFTVYRVIASPRGVYRPTRRYAEKLVLGAHAAQYGTIFPEAKHLHAPTFAEHWRGAVCGIVDGHEFVVTDEILADIAVTVAGKMYRPDTLATLAADVVAYIQGKARNADAMRRDAALLAVRRAQPAVPWLVQLAATAEAHAVVQQAAAAAAQADVLHAANRVRANDWLATIAWYWNVLIANARADPMWALTSAAGLYTLWTAFCIFFAAPQRCYVVNGRLTCQPITGLPAVWYWLRGPPDVVVVGCVPVIALFMWLYAYFRDRQRWRWLVIGVAFICVVYRWWPMPTPTAPPPWYTLSGVRQRAASRLEYIERPGGERDELFGTFTDIWRAVYNATQVNRGIVSAIGNHLRAWWRLGRAAVGQPAVGLAIARLSDCWLTIGVMGLFYRYHRRRRNRNVVVYDITTAGHDGFYFTPLAATGTPPDPRVAYRVPPVQYVAPLAHLDDESRVSCDNPFAGPPADEHHRSGYRHTNLTGKPNGFVTHGVYTNACPVVFGSGQINEHAALRQRILRARPRATNAARDAFLAWEHATFDSVYPELRQVDVLSYEDYAARFPPGKRRELMSALARLRRRDVTKRYRVSPFVKIECAQPTVGFLSPCKAPRVVSSCTPDRNIAVGPATLAVKNELCRVWSPGHTIVSAVGMNPLQIGQLVTARAQRPYKVLEGDFEKYETSRHAFSFVTWFRLYTATGADRVGPDGKTVLGHCVDALTYRGRSPHGVRARTTDVLCSGDAATTGSNTRYTGSAVAYALCVATGMTFDALAAADVLLLVAGDDWLMFVPPELPFNERVFLETLASLGLTLKLERREHVSEATFCSQRFYPARVGGVDVLMPAPKISRVFTRFLHMTSFSALPGTPYADSVIRGAAIGMLQLANHVAEIAAYMRSILRVTAGRAPIAQRRLPVSLQRSNFGALYGTPSPVRPVPGPGRFPYPVRTNLAEWVKHVAVPFFMAFHLIRSYMQYDGYLPADDPTTTYVVGFLPAALLTSAAWQAAWAIISYRIITHHGPYWEEAFRTKHPRAFAVYVVIEFACWVRGADGLTWLIRAWCVVLHATNTGVQSVRVNRHRTWNTVGYFTACGLPGCVVALLYYFLWARTRLQRTRSGTTRLFRHALVVVLLLALAREWATQFSNAADRTGVVLEDMPKNATNSKARAVLTAKHTTNKNTPRPRAFPGPGEATWGRHAGMFIKALIDRLKASPLQRAPIKKIDAAAREAKAAPVATRPIPAKPMLDKAALAKAVRASADNMTSAGPGDSVAVAPLAVGNVTTQRGFKVIGRGTTRHPKSGEVRGMIRYRGTEIIQTISGTANYTTVVLPGNPANVAFLPWMSAVALRMEAYRFIRCTIRFVTEESANKKGRIGINFDYDAADGAPNNRIGFEQQMGAKAGADWRNFSCVMRDRPAHRTGWWFIAPQGTSNGDIRDTNQFNVNVFTTDCDDTTVNGELWVDYEIELMEPTASSSGGTVGTPGAWATFNTDTTGTGLNTLGSIQVPSQGSNPGVQLVTGSVAPSSTVMSFRIYFPSLITNQNVSGFSGTSQASSWAVTALVILNSAAVITLTSATKGACVAYHTNSSMAGPATNWHSSTTTTSQTQIVDRVDVTAGQAFGPVQFGTAVTNAETNGPYVEYVITSGTANKFGSVLITVAPMGIPNGNGPAVIFGATQGKMFHRVARYSVVGPDITYIDTDLGAEPVDDVPVSLSTNPFRTMSRAAPSTPVAGADGKAAALDTKCDVVGTDDYVALLGSARRPIEIDDVYRSWTRACPLPAPAEAAAMRAAFAAAVRRVSESSAAVPTLNAPAGTTR